MRLASIFAFATLVVCALCQPVVAGQAATPHVHHVVRANGQAVAPQRLRGQSDKQVTAPQVYHVRQKTANEPHVYHVVQKGKKEASALKASQSKLGKKVEQDDELDESELEEADESLSGLEDDKKNGESDDLDESELEDAEDKTPDDLLNELEDGESDNLDESELEDAADKAAGDLLSEKDGDSDDLDESELEDATNHAVGALLGSLEDEAKAKESEDSDLEAASSTGSADVDATSEEEEEDGKEKKSKLLRRQDGKKTSEKVHGKAPHKNKSPHFKIGGQ